MSQDGDVKVKIMVDVASDSFVMLDRWDETFLYVFENMQQNGQNI